MTSVDIYIGTDRGGKNCANIYCQHGVYQPPNPLSPKAERFPTHTSFERELTERMCYKPDLQT